MKLKEGRERGELRPCQRPGTGTEAPHSLPGSITLHLRPGQNQALSLSLHQTYQRYPPVKQRANQWPRYRNASAPRLECGELHPYPEVVTHHGMRLLPWQHPERKWKRRGEVTRQPGSMGDPIAIVVSALLSQQWTVVPGYKGVRDSRPQLPQLCPSHHCSQGHPTITRHLTPPPPRQLQLHLPPCCCPTSHFQLTPTESTLQQQKTTISQQHQNAMATEENAAQTPAVDETPISVTGPNPARKNSLVNHLLHRPDRHELIESMPSAPLAAHACPAGHLSTRERNQLGLTDARLHQKTSCPPPRPRLVSRLNRRR